MVWLCRQHLHCLCVYVCKWPVSHLKAVSPPQMMNPSYVFDVVHESSLRI